LSVLYEKIAESKPLDSNNSTNIGVNNSLTNSVTNIINNIEKVVILKYLLNFWLETTIKLNIKNSAKYTPLRPDNAQSTKSNNSIFLSLHTQKTVVAHK